MKSNNESLINDLRESMKTMSKSHKVLARYIIEHYENVAFMTAKELGKKTKISESTVVRFASTIGFKGYPQMQKALASIVKDKIKAFDKIEISAQDLSSENVIESVLNSDIEKIAATLEEIDKASFETAVDIINSSETIYVVGVRNCAPLAQFFAYNLQRIFPHVVLVDSSNTSEIFEQMLHIKESDVLIGISFPHYSMRTLKAMEFAKSRFAKIVSITDSKHSPMSMYASCSLYAPTQMASVAESIVAPMSLVNALIVDLCFKNRDTVISNLEFLDEVCRDYQYSESDDIDYLNADVTEDLIKMESGDE